MELRKEHYIIHKTDGTIEEFDVDHIYSETGHLCNMQGRACGWHIQLGTYDSTDNYSEEFGNEFHEIPDSLDVVELYDSE